MEIKGRDGKPLVTRADVQVIRDSATQFLADTAPGARAEREESTSHALAMVTRLNAIAARLESIVPD